MTKLGYLIKTDSRAAILIESKKGKFKLDELQGYVGGYIERIQVRWMGTPADMIVNEDRNARPMSGFGRIHDLPLNRVTSEIARTMIVGDVVLLRKGAW